MICPSPILLIKPLHRFVMPPTGLKEVFFEIFDFLERI